MTSIKCPFTAFVRLIHRYFIWIIVSSYLIAAVMPGFGLWVGTLNLGSFKAFFRSRCDTPMT
jgi:BASS family bile acid:Na+ symporter